MSEWLQALVVAIVGLICLLQVLRRYAPRLFRRVQVRLSVNLELSPSPIFHGLGKLLRPRETDAGGGCGAGCGPCGVCVTAVSASAAVSPRD